MTKAQRKIYDLIRAEPGESRDSYLRRYGSTYDRVINKLIDGGFVENRRLGPSRTNGLFAVAAEAA